MENRLLKPGRAVVTRFLLRLCHFSPRTLSISLHSVCIYLRNVPVYFISETISLPSVPVDPDFSIKVYIQPGVFFSSPDSLKLQSQLQLFLYLNVNLRATPPLCVKRGDGGELTYRFIPIIPVGAYFSDVVDLIASFPFCSSGMSFIFLYLEMSRFINFLIKEAPNLSLILGIFLICWLITFKQCKVERMYGFSASTPYVGSRWDCCEVLMADNVIEGGAFYRAGFRSGDVLINTEFNWVKAIEPSALLAP
jgi:hypothetical protein